MFASVLSAAIFGVEVCPVQIEADVSNGLPSFIMVALRLQQRLTSKSIPKGTFTLHLISIWIGNFYGITVLNPEQLPVPAVYEAYFFFLSIHFLTCL